MSGTGAIPLRDAGRGQAGAAGDDLRGTHVRAGFPPPGAVHWAPRRQVAPVPEPSSDGPYELVFSSDVLAAMRDQIADTPRESRYGFLLGRLFRCPESGVHYAVADRALPARESFSEEAPGAYLLRAWAEAQKEFRRHPGVLMGWYHSHHHLGLLLSEGDLDANRRYFAEPWQCSVLLVPDEARPLGAVFRPGGRGPGDLHPGREPSDFWEVPAAKTGPVAAARPVLDWTNYELVDMPGTRGGERADAGGTGTPSGAERDLRAIPLVIPTETTEAAPVLPRSRSIRWPSVLGALALLAALVALVVFLFPDRSPTPSTAGSLRPDRPAPSPALIRFQSQANALRAGIDRYDERARDFDAGRIGCDLLTTGYGAVDQAFIGLATVSAALPSDAGPDPAREYSSLSAEVDQVNRHFDATGCPRPQ